LIAILGNRPALQIGRHQVLDYDSDWLDHAILRAAREAGHADFPYVGEIRSGIIEYLETKCPLKLLAIGELFERVRKMLRQIGCEGIADHLRPSAPPVTVSLIHAAMAAGSGFELGFFETLRTELDELRNLGVEEIEFTGLRESACILRGVEKWDRRCEILLGEIESFLANWKNRSPGVTKAA
jgi:hypothetical protein